MGGKGGKARSAPFGGGNELKKTGARSARARTRGQNPLVQYIYVQVSMYKGMKVMNMQCKFRP